MTLRFWSEDEVNAVHCRPNVTTTKKSALSNATDLHHVFSELLIIDEWCLDLFWYSALSGLHGTTGQNSKTSVE